MVWAGSVMALLFFVQPADICNNSVNINEPDFGRHLKTVSPSHSCGDYCNIRQVFDA